MNKIAIKPVFILVDTSVFVNIIKLPNKSQDHENVVKELSRLISRPQIFKLILPLATVWEAGNLIAKNTNGSIRRKFAKIYVEQVKLAIKGESPWTPYNFPDSIKFLEWLSDYPDQIVISTAKRSAGQGLSLGDHSIIKIWTEMKDKSNLHRVKIWSLDADLQVYDTDPDDRVT